MAINMCTDIVGTTITCDTVCSEDYPASNLLSAKSGFMCDHFIRCPVALTLDFSCPIDIESVRILSVVVSQKSSAFELYCGRNSDEELQFVSKWFNLDESILIFRNPSFQKRLKVNPMDQEIFPLENGRVVNIPAKQRNRFKDVTRIKLVIMRTMGSSIPCLGKLEVWGEPSNDSEASNDVISKWTMYFARKAKFVQLEHCEDLGSEKVESDLAEVPTEFLDSLTFVIMALPMRLPSGNIVDQSTIERFNAEQALLGRHPCDPFTGVPFSSILKPIFAAELKAQIDEFVFKKNTCYLKSSVAKELQDAVVKRQCYQPSTSHAENITGRAEPTVSSKRRKINVPEVSNASALFRRSQTRSPGKS